MWAVCFAVLLDLAGARRRFHLVGKYYPGLKQTAAGHARLSVNSSKTVLLSIALDILNVSDIITLRKAN